MSFHPATIDNEKGPGEDTLMKRLAKRTLAQRAAKKAEKVALIKKMNDKLDQLVSKAEAVSKDLAHEAWHEVEASCAKMSAERPAFPRPYITRSKALVALGRLRDAEAALEVGVGKCGGEGGGSGGATKGLLKLQSELENLRERPDFPAS